MEKAHLMKYLYEDYIERWWHEDMM